jgi:hypothetical protein
VKHEPVRAKWRALFYALGLIAGLGLIGYGGYLIDQDQLQLR